MIIDKIYMINLKRKKYVADNSINRLNNLTKNNNLFSNINIFEAIDGQLLNKNDINSHLTLKAKYTFINPNSYDDIRSIGEIGCYLSHTQIWKEIIDNNYKNCIILEDDVIPYNNYETIINYLDNIPNDYDIAYLGWWSRSSFDYINKNSYWLSTEYDNNNKQNILGLYSYVLSNNGAQKLLSKAFPMDVQLDTYVSLYNNVNKDFKRYLSKEKLFEADKTILGNEQTHTVCEKCKFFNYMYKNNLFY
jgi:GR25 family glycosyltransferase involved in LPS biosynthesis